MYENIILLLWGIVIPHGPDMDWRAREWSVDVHGGGDKNNVTKILREALSEENAALADELHDKELIPLRLLWRMLWV